MIVNWVLGGCFLLYTHITNFSPRVSLFEGI